MSFKFRLCLCLFLLCLILRTIRNVDSPSEYCASFDDAFRNHVTAWHTNNVWIGCLDLKIRFWNVPECAARCWRASCFSTNQLKFYFCRVQSKKTIVKNNCLTFKTSGCVIKNKFLIFKLELSVYIEIRLFISILHL